MENIREICLDILLAMEKGEGYDGKMIKDVLDKYDYLDRRDKAFIKRLTEGTIERRIELDYYIDATSKTPTRKMKPLIRSLLRMSVYQILYMDAVPDAAVCNEAVKLAGKRRFSSLKGFVNGVLRNIARKKESPEGLPLPDQTKAPLSFLSVKYSMPEWIVDMWISEYGYEKTEAILADLLEDHPVSIRFVENLTDDERQELCRKIRECGVELEESGYTPLVCRARNVDNIQKLPGYREGLFTVQDVSSVLSVLVAGIKKTDVVMDVCAAPGGKTLLSAEKAQTVISWDISEEKTARIRENMERMKAGNIICQVHDARIPDEAYFGRADVLILDVPCSGLGVMGKKRDIKYNVTPEGISQLLGLQREIVTASWQYVKPGGILMYSTCTIDRAENEEMVQWILEKFPFDVVDMTKEAFLPETFLADYADAMPFGGADGRQAGIQLLPGFIRSDGFFFAKFRRTE